MVWPLQPTFPVRLQYLCRSAYQCVCRSLSDNIGSDHRTNRSIALPTKATKEPPSSHVVHLSTCLSSLLRSRSPPQERFCATFGSSSPAARHMADSYRPLSLCARHASMISSMGSFDRYFQSLPRSQMVIRIRSKSLPIDERRAVFRDLSSCLGHGRSRRDRDRRHRRRRGHQLLLSLPSCVARPEDPR